MPQVAAFRKRLEKVVGDKHEEVMGRMGAIMATGPAAALLLKRAGLHVPVLAQQDECPLARCTGLVCLVHEFLICTSHCRSCESRLPNSCSCCGLRICM